MNEIGKKELIAGFEKLGIPKSCTAIVHSSLSSLGKVKGGALTLIKSLLASVGKEGNILVPTLTGNDKLSVLNPPVFNPIDTESWTGIIPETFRKLPYAIRSIHPTHSVSVIGQNAEALTSDHINSITPCDEVSPYGKMAMMADSYIILIGVDYESVTMFHHIEEISGVDYHIQPEMVNATLIIKNKKITKKYFLHRYGFERHFGIMEDLFKENGIHKETRIGESNVKLININKMANITFKALRANKNILLKKSKI